ncbi:MAG: ATP-binding cassette domain-containing protein [Coriobacteriia bacterium]|nr:ATP-binding cassette domain-containing protein [Coriobacteriia bacterium]
MIEVKDLSKTFDLKHSQHEALQNVNLTIENGDIYGIIGMSGAGKSTLVRCLNLLEKPSSGKIIVDGLDVTGLNDQELLEYRKKISMVFQNFNLFSQKTALQNVAFPLEISGNKEDARKRALELLAQVGLEDKASSYPSQLSGGQKQRVAIARALANHPNYILCDEATSALDTLSTNSILKLLRDIVHTMGVTLVVITHSIDVVEKICNKVAVLDQGRVIEQGLVKEVFEQPQSDITKQLLGKIRWDA